MCCGNSERRPTNIFGKNTDLNPVTESYKTSLRVRSLIDAPPSAVWRAITKQPSAWWGPTPSADTARKVVLEPRLGGLLYEEHGPGAGVLWGQVSELHPRRDLVISGPLGIAGATAGELRLELEPMDDGEQTHVLARIGVTGAVTEGLRAQLLHQWEVALGERLPAWIERGETRGLTRTDFNEPLRSDA